MTSDDYLGFLMLAILVGVIAVMVRDGIKTRQIYRRMADAERLERAERAERIAGVEASPDPARELLRQSREALRKDGRFVSTGEHVELRRAISAYLGDFGYGEQPDPCGVPGMPNDQQEVPRG